MTTRTTASSSSSSSARIQNMIRHKERLFSDASNDDQSNSNNNDDDVDDQYYGNLNHSSTNISILESSNHYNSNTNNNRSSNILNNSGNRTLQKRPTTLRRPQTAKGRSRNASDIQNSTTRLQGKQRRGFGDLYEDDEEEFDTTGGAAHSGDVSQLELASLNNSDEELPSSYNETISRRNPMTDKITSGGVAQRSNNPTNNNKQNQENLSSSQKSNKEADTLKKTSPSVTSSISSSLNSAQFLSMKSGHENTNSSTLNPPFFKKNVGSGMIASAPSSPAKRSHPNSYLRTKILNAPKSPNTSINNNSQIVNSNQNTFQMISSLFEKKIQRLETEKKNLQQQIAMEQENTNKVIVELVHKKAHELKLDEQQGQNLMDLVSGKTTIARLKKEISNRDEKIEMIEKEREDLNNRIEEISQQYEQALNQIKKLTFEKEQSQNSEFEKVDNINKLEELNLQIQQDNNELENELNTLKTTIEELQKERDAFREKCETTESQLKQMLAFQRQNQSLVAENQRLAAHAQHCESQFKIKLQEYEEISKVQDELLRAIAEEKKKVAELTKSSSGDLQSKEKLAKENERLELLVDKLSSDFKQKQLENIEQRNLLLSQFENKETQLVEENQKLKRDLEELNARLSQEQKVNQNTQHSQQQRISQLTEQLKEQTESLKNIINENNNEAALTKQKHSQQVAKLKKELHSSFEMIKLLREANKKMEENFTNQQKIITSMELQLETAQAQNKDLKEQLEILKVKLPKLLKASLSSK
ncbi:hypothetical protein FDP41_001373 [Naegleria fowleri]|uniref:Uncharacterized protein n=1 Tax=Naegleria fowleri TaxID=5763 RepID=A0A6A5C2H3_NAEFO|nr:uncharacterized protein FDP41_001373 [Naegleria fowleri]KAF0979705.1 hypothetical protein FDP41_001373 [Naegleria fowleri]